MFSIAHAAERVVGTLQKTPAEVKNTADATSVLIVVGWVINALPGMATFLTVLWMGIRVYETATVQRLIHGKKRPLPRYDDEGEPMP